MARLSRAQSNARELIARAAEGGLPPRALGRRFMEALSVALGNDGYRLLGVDPDTMLVNRLLTSSADDEWARLEWLRHYYLASEPLSYVDPTAIMRLDLPAVVVQERQDAC
jgi:hypothetical protein